MKLPQPGLIYYASYLRFHEDRRPLIFVLYADTKYCHALNLHYFPKGDYDRLVKLFVKIKEDERVNKLFLTDKHAFYHSWLKKHFKDVIEKCYRTYHQGLLLAVPTTAIALSGVGLYITNTYQDKAPRDKKHNQLRKAARKDDAMKQLLRDYNVFRAQSWTMKMIGGFKKWIRGK